MDTMDKFLKLHVNTISILACGGSWTVEKKVLKILLGNKQYLISLKFEFELSILFLHLIKFQRADPRKANKSLINMLLYLDQNYIQTM